MNQDKTILDLCSGTGSWSRPYVEAGYNVIQVDALASGDVRLLEFTGPVHGVLAAPPCTHLAVSGARWWEAKGNEALVASLSVADACLRIVMLGSPKWWALENPVGRLRRFYGPPTLIFNPCDYGDPYTKKTLLWGKFSIPKQNPVAPTEGSKMHLMPPSADRARLRSQTPAGFAQQFFLANP